MGEREPCPFRIFVRAESPRATRVHPCTSPPRSAPSPLLFLTTLHAQEDMGGGFLLGAVGGGLFHFVKGYRNAPIGQRWSGAFAAARLRAPVLGGNFGVWGGLFSVFDCSIAAYRRREDAWNAICAGGLTGGLLAARAGPKAMARNALGGALILAVIEGGMMLMTKFIYKAQMAQLSGGKAVAVDRLEPPVPPGYQTRNRQGDASFQLA